MKLKINKNKKDRNKRENTVVPLLKGNPFCKEEMVLQEKWWPLFRGTS
jgi:hypothetical protein